MRGRGWQVRIVFNQWGDLERCALRPGNVHSAHEWRDVLEPVVAPHRSAQTEAPTNMTNGQPLIRADDRTGATGNRPKDQFRPPTTAIGPSSDEIGMMMTARGLHLAFPTFSNDAQATRRVPHGDSRLKGFRSDWGGVVWSRVILFGLLAVARVAQVIEKVGQGWWDRRSSEKALRQQQGEVLRHLDTLSDDEARQGASASP